MSGYMERMNGLELSFGSFPDEQGNMVPSAMTYRTSYESNAVAVEGWRVDRFNMDLEFPEALGGLGGAMPGMSAQHGLIAGRENQIVYLMRNDEALLNAAIAQATLGTGGLAADERLASLRAAALLPNPSAKLYIDAGGFADMLSGWLGAVEDGSFDFDLGDDVPLAAIFGHRGAANAGFRVFVPYGLIRAVMQTVDRLSTTPI